MIIDIRSYVYDMIMCDGCEEWFHLNCIGLKFPSPDSLLINGTVVQHVKCLSNYCKHIYLQVTYTTFHILYCKQSNFLSVMIFPRKSNQHARH